MLLSDFHAHSKYSDGRETLEEMVKSAISLGLSAFGMSEHAHTPFEDFTLRAERYDAYKTEVSRLKDKYAGQIELFCGVEQDIYADIKPHGFDYVIGAVHSLKTGGGYVYVDAGADSFAEAAENCFGGDYYAFAEEYFRLHSQTARITKCDIAAHFDLVTKNNEGGRFFDTSHPRYRRAAVDAMTELLKDCRVFEVNTGAMFRAGRSEAYPQVWLLRELRERGGEVILSSDAHSVDAIGYRFNEMEDYLREAGFRYRKTLTSGGFSDIKL